MRRETTYLPAKKGRSDYIWRVKSTIILLTNNQFP
jgi:hypothetical protein